MPQLKCQTRNIDGLDVSVTEFGVFRQVALSARLGKLVAPAAGAIDLNAGLRGDALEGIAALLMHADPTELQALTRELFASTEIIDRTGPEPRKFQLISDAEIEDAFNGRLITMFRALAFVIETNFAAPFGGALRGLVRSAGGRQASQSESTSPTASRRRRSPHGGSGSKGESP